MRVLILADSCNPEWASLPSVGYKAARAIAELAEVVVVTHVRNRENIGKVGLGRAQVRYIDNEYIARPMYKVGKVLRGGTQTAWTTAVAMAYPSYLTFEWEAWKATKEELLRGKFDVVHRITPMSPTLPSPFASWSPVPFVLGPLNGGLRWLPAFRAELAREHEWLSYVRSAYRLLPYYKSTYRKSSAVLAAFAHTVEDLPACTGPRIINFPEVGIDPTQFDRSAERPVRSQKTILFAGRFVPYKLPDVVVRAFAGRPALRAHRLIMVGDGPERTAVEHLVRSHNLENQVNLLGWKSQSEVGQLMREADIFAFPSIRELGAGVVVEAMACGLACVVVNYGAPGTLIAEGRGIKVPAESRDQIVRDFGVAFESLVADERATTRLGKAAREHAMKFYTWEAKARKMISVYEWVLGLGEKPSFW